MPLGGTLESGEATILFALARRALAQGQDASGNHMRVRNVSVDCDRDTLAGHRRSGWTCLPHRRRKLLRRWRRGRRAGGAGAHDRRAAKAGGAEAIPALADEWRKRIAQKVSEEGVECARSQVRRVRRMSFAKGGLAYHLAVLLHARGRSFDDVFAVLAKRAGAKR